MMLRPPPPPPQTERFLCPKDLSRELERAHGILLSHRATCLLTERMRAAGLPVIRRNHARPDDAAQWLLTHPNWRPYQRG